MLKKEKMIPGSRIKVGPVVKDGVPAMYGGGGTKPYLTLMHEPGKAVFFQHAGVGPNAVLEIVKGPKKYDGINCAIVKDSADTEFYAFWCELRASCDHV